MLVDWCDLFCVNIYLIYNDYGDLCGDLVVYWVDLCCEFCY